MISSTHYKAMPSAVWTNRKQESKERCWWPELRLSQKEWRVGAGPERHHGGKRNKTKCLVGLEEWGRGWNPRFFSEFSFSLIFTPAWHCLLLPASWRFLLNFLMRRHCPASPSGHEQKLNKWPLVRNSTLHSNTHLSKRLSDLCGSGQVGVKW